MDFMKILEDLIAYVSNETLDIEEVNSIIKSYQFQKFIDENDLKFNQFSGVPLKTTQDVTNYFISLYNDLILNKFKSTYYSKSE
jgi:uncharacterized membrane-anchored protein YjiN (DUF445 family)